jgi:hypothetical protein
LILISAWLVVVVFGLIMCRVAARSDDAHAVEIAEWIATNHVAERADPAADSPAERLALDAQHAPYRATG